MKSIFSFKVDLSHLEGAISKVTDLNAIINTTKNSQEQLNKGFLDDSTALTKITLLTKSMQKLKGVTGATNDLFSKLGKTIRSISSNFLSKFMSVLKTGLGLLGSLSAAVLGVFNMANGSNVTATDAAYSGLSWAGQKALENATNETGLSLDFANFEKAGKDDVNLQKDLAVLGLNKDEYQKIQDKETGFYEMAKLLKSRYDSIEAPDEFTRNETFSSIYGETLQNQLGMDWKDFLTVMNSGALGRHEERFNATQRRYSGVDAQALMKGERALDDFSETLKSFALTVASKFLPGLTQSLKGFTKIATKATEWLGKSGLIESAANTIGTIFGAFSKIANTLSNAFSESTGSSIVEFIKGVFSFIGNLAQLLASIITGDWAGIAKSGKAMYNQVKAFGDGAEKLIHRGISNVAEETVKGVNFIAGTEFDAKAARGYVDDKLQKVREFKYGVRDSMERGGEYVLEKTRGLVNEETREKTINELKNDASIAKEKIISVPRKINDFVIDSAPKTLGNHLRETREIRDSILKRNLQTVSNTTINIPGQKPLKVQTVNNYNVDPVKGVIAVGKAQTNVSGGLL